MGTEKAHSTSGTCDEPEMQQRSSLMLCREQEAGHSSITTANNEWRGFVLARIGEKSPRCLSTSSSSHKPRGPAVL